jgi:acid stress-induced BolA-like protein IbaG/YrbA
LKGLLKRKIQMRVNNLHFFVLIAVMLSGFSRAFTSVGRTATPRAAFARAMSSDAPDTSVVDICTQKIQDALETTEVKVTGAYDDPNGSHIAVEVVSEKFEGKRAVQRQQLVYKAIWEELQGPVHAVDSMICRTPEEA